MASSFSQPQHEPDLDRGQRRARGVFYTPVEIANWIVAETYGPLVEAWPGNGPPPRVLDPACGGGVFLQAALEKLNECCRRLDLSPARSRAACKQAIFGIDIDRLAVETARKQLAAIPRENIRCADTLSSSECDSFDAIVGNPPYVSIRELAQAHSRDEIEKLRKRFSTARGNFDLYVPFWERALELLRPGGRLGFIVPNKWATLDYARPLRELLLQQTTLEQIVDVSALRVFPAASAYPQIVILKRKPASKLHCIRVALMQESQEFNPLTVEANCRKVEQAKLDASSLVLGEDLALEQRVATRPLGSICELHSGASGYSAALLAGELREATSPSDRDEMALNFIVSGNIDRYAIAPGNVRFLKQLWQRPCLPIEAGHVTAAKLQLYREPKIVLSGMCRRLEAAYDEQGFALGVQVFAARELQVDPYYLLAILNSKLLSYLFRERFAAKRLAGGYLAINKGQLAQLPIRLTSDLPAATVKRIASRARQLHQAVSSAVDEQLDELIYELYELTREERQRVEQSFVPDAASVRSKQAIKTPQRFAA
jgi:methylase of polypeptide subunit release factors